MVCVLPLDVCPYNQRRAVHAGQDGVDQVADRLVVDLLGPRRLAEHTVKVPLLGHGGEAPCAMLAAGLLLHQHLRLALGAAGALQPQHRVCAAATGRSSTLTRTLPPLAVPPPSGTPASLAPQWRGHAGPAAAAGTTSSASSASVVSENEGPAAKAGAAALAAAAEAAEH